MAGANKPDATIGDLSVRRAQAGRALARLARLDASAAELVQLVAATGHIGPEDILRRARRADIAAGRQLAMYLTHVGLGRTLTEVGALFGRDRTTVAYACAQIEDHRDDPAFDAEVAELEAAIDRRELVDVAAGDLRRAG